MKRRYQRSMKGERGGRAQSINPTQREQRGREGGREGGGGGRKRKIAFRLCSVKGEITHLRRFFQATTGFIDQTSGFMSQFST